MTENRKPPTASEIVIPEPTLRRIPMYYQYLKRKQQDERLDASSSTTMAADLSLNPIQIRKDLEWIGATGKPRTGYDIEILLAHMEDFLGYNNAHDAFIVGAGHLGQALLGYEGFEDYGLNIVAAFDSDPAKADMLVAGKKVLPMEKLEDMVKRLHILIGILAVPSYEAQTVCDRMVAAGIKAVWNFTPYHLTVPDGVIVQHENMATSLAVLANKLEVALRKAREQGNHHDHK
ncbi:MAG: redox-sensing transcriptional repressor Rex [Clostridiaceae bacterium]|nr:redox-sensing transcriptional repressor Rex [Clostridiaceae bacterium]